MALVFMYGPDTLQRRTFDRIGRSDFVGPAVLEGFELVFDKPSLKNKLEGLPNLRQAEGAAVFGVLFELSPKQEETLAGFFGGYEAKPVRPVLASPRASGPVTARAFFARRTKSGLKPSRATLEAMRLGFDENGAGAEFRDALSGIEHVDA